jgi:hypothetical protein
MVELGTLQNHAVTLNISYMQVHPAMDNEVLPLGVSLETLSRFDKKNFTQLYV